MTCLLLLGAVGEPPRVRAQANVEDARTTFAQAEASFAEDDLPRALELFRRAFELVPNDAVRFNIAVCLERLGRFREATEEYALAAHSPRLDEATRARASELEARTRTRLGALAITGGPAGAEILIDGESLCRVPCHVDLDPGRHEVRLAGALASSTQRVEVRRGEEAVVVIDGRGDPSTDPIAVLPTARRGFELSWLSWTGATLALGGGGLTLGLGLWSSDLHAQYVAAPDAATRDTGLATRDGANVALGVGCLGITLMIVDVVVAVARQDEALE
jgi:hypothetical protein